MKIKKIKIDSFRGLKNLEFDLKNKINVFSGANGLGKSTIIDSIMWVLTDETLVYGKQNSDNRNFENLKDVIKVTLELDNGAILERTYYDKWKEDADGNLKFDKVINEFRINGAKYGSKEYFEFIKDNILKLDRNILVPKDYNILRSLMDYNYFGSIDYKISRAFLEKILNLKSDEELLSEEQFAPIKIDMQVLKYDIAKTINKFKNEFDNLDKDIKTKEMYLKDLEEKVDISKLEQLDSLTLQRNELFNSNFDLEPENLRLNQLLDLIYEEIKEQEENTTEAIFEAQQKINNLVIKGSKCDTDVISLNREIESNNKLLESSELYIKDLEEEINEINNEKFEETTCPNCKIVLNASEKDLFEEKKKIRIASINEKIADTQNKRLKYKEYIENNEKEIAEITFEKEQLGKEYFETKEKLSALEKQKQENEKVKELKAKEFEIKTQIDEEKKKYLFEKNRKFEELNSKIAEYSEQQTLPSRIEILKTEIKDLKVKRAYSEHCIDLAKEFKELKLQLIKQNIGNVFPTLDIEIIEENENTGSMKEVCYLKLKNVEYKGINDGHRKMIGITFIENVKKKLNLQDLPIVFDKYADIDNEMVKVILNMTNSQIFSTKVGNEKEITLYGN